MIAASAFTQHAASLVELYDTKPVIRVCNFHSTPRHRAKEYDHQLSQYAQFFSSVNEEELAEYLITGNWHKPKPGLIVAVYEAFRNGYDVLAPLLERHGFTGWFFVITGFIDTAPADQVAFAETHRIRMRTFEYPDARYALTWDELRQLDRKHVIASHTRSHRELSLLDWETAEHEVVGAQEDLRCQLGHPAHTFASLTGPAFGDHGQTDRLILQAGYRYVFSNYRIQRVRL